MALGRFLLFVFSLMQCLVLLSLYQGMILSSLFSRRPEALLANDEQLLEKVASGEAQTVMRDSGNW